MRKYVRALILCIAPVLLMTAVPTSNMTVTPVFAQGIPQCMVEGVFFEPLDQATCDTLLGEVMKAAGQAGTALKNFRCVGSQCQLSCEVGALLLCTITGALLSGPLTPMGGGAVAVGCAKAVTKLICERHAPKPVKLVPVEAQQAERIIREGLFMNGTKYVLKSEIGSEILNGSELLAPGEALLKNVQGSTGNVTANSANDTALVLGGNST